MGNSSKSTLGYSQSGISQQIFALERITGAPLLTRHPGGRRPGVAVVPRLTIDLATPALVAHPLPDIPRTELAEPS